MVKKYIPDVGDVVWINCDPSVGNEHKKRRPAIILSPRQYNKLTSLCVCCPMTSKQKGYPFEVAVDNDSVVLSDQVRSLDWVSRKAEYKSKIDTKILNEVKNKIFILLQII